MKSVGIGMLGAGVVGGSLIRRLVEEHVAIASKTGLDLHLQRVAVRDREKARATAIDPQLITTDAAEVIDDPAVELVVEVMGGLEPAGEMVLRALRAGKPVVTANKALLAERGPELFAAAESAGVPLLFEAAVGGGIPIIRPLSETLAGEQVARVIGIVNGTTNFMLTRMAVDGASYAGALQEAQQLGYAEADPTADVSGADAAAKAAILGSLAFGTWSGLDTVYREGIERLTTADMRWAAELGYTIKLLAIAERRHDGVSVRVYPAMLPVAHPLASIRGATNAIFIEGPSIDELLFAGPGAGGEPTASAVLGDVIDAAREILAGAQVAPRIRLSAGDLVDFDTVATKWCMRLEVDDQAGVLAQVAGAFGKENVSIKSVLQEGRGDDATLIIVTHLAAESQQRAARDAIADLPHVRSVVSVVRVESPDV